MSKRTASLIAGALAGVGLLLLATACGGKTASDASPPPVALAGSPSGQSAVQTPSASPPASSATAKPPSSPVAATASPAATAAAAQAPSSAAPPSARPAQTAAPEATAAPVKATEPPLSASTSKPAPAPTPTPTPAPTPTPVKETAEQIVNVQASYFVWKLDQTTVKAGTPVHFRVTSTEGLHGFSIEGTSVNMSVDEGKTEDVKWTPTKPGVYTIRCNQYCGSGHAQMAVTLTVT